MGGVCISVFTKFMVPLNESLLEIWVLPPIPALNFLSSFPGKNPWSFKKETLALKLEVSFPPRIDTEVFEATPVLKNSVTFS